MTPLLSLGRHVFQTDALNYQSIKRASEAKWPIVERFGTHPGRQFTGHGEETINIRGLLFPNEFEDRQQYEAVRQTQAAGRPVMLLGWSAGFGVAAELFGRVVILRIQDTQTSIDASGRGRKIEYELDLAPLRGEGKPIGLFG